MRRLSFTESLHLLAVGAGLAGFIACGGGSTAPVTPPAAPPPPPPPPAVTGAVQFTVATSGVDPDPDGYALLLNGQTTQVGAGGSATLSAVNEGTYSLEISGVAPNCSIDLATPYTVAVVGGSTKQVDVKVFCLSTRTRQNGQIVYWSGRGAPAPNVAGRTEIYLMNSDGTAQTALTSTGEYNEAPMFSPDATKIAFASGTFGGNNLSSTKIFVMNVDGSAGSRVTNTAASEDSPVWSRDGKHIAFGSSRDAGTFLQLFIMNADGTSQTKISSSNAVDAAWSPDGRRIVFSSFSGGSFVLRVVNGDGSGEKVLATGQNPSWCSDGRIAFSRAGNIFVMNGDGSAQTQISNSSRDYGPSWSPDCSRIVFGRYAAATGLAADLYVMKPDGTGLIQVTSTSFEYGPNWGALKP